MNMWTAIFLITFTAIAGEAYRHYLKSRSKGDKPGQVNALNDRIDALETELRERVETLERIVTDRKEDLKRQFDYLDKTG